MRFDYPTNLLFSYDPINSKQHTDEFVVTKNTAHFVKNLSSWFKESDVILPKLFH